MIMITLIVIINVIGIYQVDIMFFGFYGLVVLWNIFTFRKLKLGEIIWFTFVFVLIHMLVKHSINFLFKYDTVSPDGENVTVVIKIIAGIITLVLSEFITVVFGLISMIINKGKMKSLSILFLILAIVFSSCNSKIEVTNLNGDLYFGFLRIGSYYNQPDSMIVKFEQFFTKSNFDNFNQDEKEIFGHYEKLKKLDLLYSPFVEILTDNDSVVNLYLELEDYNKIKIYKRQKLQDEKKKVRISALVRKIDNKLYYCEKLEKVELIDGETLQVQRKFRIEDYN